MFDQTLNLPSNHYRYDILEQATRPAGEKLRTLRESMSDVLEYQRNEIQIYRKVCRKYSLCIKAIEYKIKAMPSATFEMYKNNPSLLEKNMPKVTDPDYRDVTLDHSFDDFVKEFHPNSPKGIYGRHNMEMEASELLGKYLEGEYLSPKEEWLVENIFDSFRSAEMQKEKHDDKLVKESINHFFDLLDQGKKLTPKGQEALEKLCNSRDGYDLLINAMGAERGYFLYSNDMETDEEIAFRKYTYDCQVRNGILYFPAFHVADKHQYELYGAAAKELSSKFNIPLSKTYDKFQVIRLVVPENDYGRFQDRLNEKNYRCMSISSVDCSRNITKKYELEDKVLKAMEAKDGKPLIELSGENAVETFSKNGFYVRYKKDTNQFEYENVDRGYKHYFPNSENVSQVAKNNLTLLYDRSEHRPSETDYYEYTKGIDLGERKCGFDKFMEVKQKYNPELSPKSLLLIKATFGGMTRLVSMGDNADVMRSVFANNNYKVQFYKMACNDAIHWNSSVAKHDYHYQQHTVSFDEVHLQEAVKELKAAGYKVDVERGLPLEEQQSLYMSSMPCRQRTAFDFERIYGDYKKQSVFIDVRGERKEIPFYTTYNPQTDQLEMFVDSYEYINAMENEGKYPVITSDYDHNLSILDQIDDLRPFVEMNIKDVIEEESEDISQGVHR